MLTLTNIHWDLDDLVRELLREVLNAGATLTAAETGHASPHRSADRSNQQCLMWRHCKPNV
jgi:hypothetical protein